MQTDAELRELIEQTRSIAVLGAKTGAEEDAWRVPRYLRHAGFRILAVNPKLALWEGEPAYPTLGAVPGPVDLIEVFRAAAHLPGHVDEILALPWRPRGVWFQLGIRDDASATRLEAAGIGVVQDRCLMVDHRRLSAP
jgi:predicted CoA-binding protein